ncbi:MAG: hypothetical protein ACFCGT_20400 [Sandaracinaceae bacterium]
MPARRTDLGAGGSFRVPLGPLDGGEPPDAGARLLTFAQPGGAVPVAFVRRGVGDRVDLGAQIAGSTGRVAVRGTVPAGGGLRLVLGLSPHAGWLETEPAQSGQAFRAGVELPVVLAFDVSSLYSAWFGLRLGVDHANGRIGPTDARRDAYGTGLRTGGVFGMGVGFRRFHLLMEIAIDHEAWWGRLGTVRVERNGVVVVPSFAFRLRV